MASLLSGRLHLGCRPAFFSGSGITMICIGCRAEYGIKPARFLHHVHYNSGHWMFCSHACFEKFPPNWYLFFQNTWDIPGVYTLTCLASQRIYVGQSRRIGSRVLDHFRYLCRGTHPVIVLQSRFDEKLFKPELVQVERSVKKRLKVEQDQILQHRSRLFNLPPRWGYRESAQS